MKELELIHTLRSRLSNVLGPPAPIAIAFVVGAEGLEPSHLAVTPLKRVCIPIPPRSHIGNAAY